LSEEFFNQYSLHMKNVQGLRSSAARAVTLAKFIPLCVQYEENIYAKRQARAAFERRILQSIDCKMVSEEKF
jgi:hypothetical protein